MRETQARAEAVEESGRKPRQRGTVEGFTLVLMIAWLILLATFAGMYYMDQTTKKAAEKSTEAPQSKARGG